MSDFFSGGWSIYIAALTIVSLVACLALLIIASRRRVMADDNTTGHVWDEDLKELNNPLPRWWMWLFVITVAFAGAYLALYPGLGSAPGSLKWSSTGQLQSETDKAVAAMAPVYARYVSMTAEQLAMLGANLADLDLLFGSMNAFETWIKDDPTASMQAAMAWLDSGAGTMPSDRANMTPALKVASCGTATASTSFS
jgi:hypothetical protein